MPKHAYLILAHNNWSILSKCLALLDSPDNDIYLLVDARARDFDPSKLHACRSARLFEVERIKVFWADYSQVKAYLSMLDAAFRTERSEGISYSYFHLQTGVCLPLKSQKYIHDFCDGSGKEFIGIVPREFPYCTRRTRVYWPFIATDLFRKSKPFKALVYGLAWLQRVVGVNRLRKSDFRIYNGWSNCSISHDLAEYLLRRKDLVYSMFHHTLAPDELWVHTLAYNSPFRDRIYAPSDLRKGSMRDIDWKRGKPYTWGREPADLETLLASPCLFARKFDENTNIDIVNRLCNAVMQMENMEEI